MRMRFGIFLLGLVLVASQASKAANYPTCHIHKSRDVSFQNAMSKDRLEVSIGTGPCYAATMTIVIRSDKGAVLYSYVAPFKRHVATNWESSDLDKRAYDFVGDVVRQGVGSTRDLPPYLEPSAYWEEHYNEIKISRPTYEQLRVKPHPMFSHPNHYEGWQTVVFDEAKEESVLILAGGL
jgi:hypothetical protein